MPKLRARTVKRYGWKPDLPDHRDLCFEPAQFGAEAPSVLPSSVDLEANCPAVYDQGQLGSCTANAIGGAIEFDLMKQGVTAFVPSRLFIYYNERVIERTVKTDSGAQIRDGIKSISQAGAPPETDWPYSVRKFSVKPSAKAYKNALNNTAVKYGRVNQNIASIKTALASGFPVVFGFTVYESFEDQIVATTGLLNMPTDNEQVVGGHAVLCVGYDDATQRVKVRNSWGKDWGLNGYFTMPYEYISNPNLADDLWCVQAIK